MIAVLSLLIVCSFSAVGLWTLWAASLPWHWLLRALLALAPVSLLLLVPAYEPFVAFVTEITVIAGGITLGARWSRTRREPRTHNASHGVRFSLGSLLGAMLLIAAAAALAVRLPRLNWQAWVNTVLIGASCGASVLIAVLFVRVRTGWWHAVLGALLLGVVAQPLIWTDYLLPSFDVFSPGWPPDNDTLLSGLFNSSLGRRWAWAVILPCIAALIAHIVSRVFRCGWLSSRFVSTARLVSPLSPVRRCLLRAGLVILCSLLVVPPAYFLVPMIFPDPFPEKAASAPNGYDDLLAAARLAADPIFDDYDTATRGQLQRALDALPLDVFERLQLGLNRSSHVPLEYRDPYGDLKMDDMMAFRALSRALMAQAQVHRYGQQWESAARTYIHVVNLGRQVGTRGLMVHALVGNAIAGTGQFGLVEIHGSLGPEASADAARDLLQIDSAGDFVAQMLYRERLWVQHAEGWHGRIWLALLELMGEPMPNSEGVTRLLEESQTVRRLLAVELALQAYTAEHGSPPAHLDDLVPEFLSRVPDDPSSGSAFSYEVTPDGHRLTAGGFAGEHGSRSGADALIWPVADFAEPFSLDEWYAKQNEN